MGGSSSVQVTNAADIGETGFADLVSKLDEIQMANAALTESTQCCLANAMMGLNPISGEPAVSAGGDEGVDVEEPPALDIFGEAATQPDGSPLSCPSYNSLQGRPQTYVRKVSDSGANIYCVPGFTYAYADSGNPEGPPAGYDYLRLDDPNDSTVAKVAGGPFTCSSATPIDATIEAQYEGREFFPEIALVCPAVAPVTACEELETTNLPSAYYKMWQQYLAAYKDNQKWYQGLYGAQAILALISTIESIKLYNDILDKQLDMICDVKDDVALVAKCSASLLGDGTDENPGILKECQSALLEDHVGRIGIINNRARFSCDAADDMWDLYAEVYKPLDNFYVPKLADKLYSMICNGEMSSDKLESWACTMDDLVKGEMVPGISELFSPLIDSAQCVTANLNDWRESVRSKAIALDDHYRTTYQTPEKTMIPAVMDMATCLTQRVCEMRSWLMQSAHDSEQLYREGYRPGEAAQAKAAMSSAASAIPHLCDTISWLETNTAASLNLFQACYGDGTEKLNPTLFQNAHELAPEVRCLYKFFAENGTEYKDFWNNCYKDRHCRFVKRQLDVAYKLLNYTEASIKRVDKWAQRDRATFDLHFRQLEIEKTPDIIYNGNDGSHARSDIRDFWIEKSESLHKTFDTVWKPCDINNLQQHCDLWADHNPLKELLLNSECMKDLSTDAQEAYSAAILAAERSLEEACEPAEEFKYCIEDKAVAHVRKLADIAEEELFRCSSRYCAGATEEAQIRLRSEMAKAEGGAYAAAERWKWWANETLRDKRFAQKQQAIQTLQALGAISVQAVQAGNDGLARVLSSMDSAIVRGYNYPTLSQSESTLALNASSGEVSDMMQMLQLWRFYPEMALRNQSEAHRMTQQVYNDAQGIMNEGHYWTDAASREKNSALNIGQSSIDIAVRLSEIGQFHLRQAESMNAQRASTAQAAAQTGLGFAQTGHNLHQIAGSRMEGTMAQSISGVGQGLQASRIGVGIEATALQQENTTTLNALRHMQAGMEAMQFGRSMLSDTLGVHQSQVSDTSNAATHLLNMLRTGQNTATLSMGASEACFQQQFEMLCKAKDYVQRNFALVQSSLHGGTSGTLANTNDLLQSQASQAGGSFGSLGNSLENLIQLSNPTPPFGSGQATFGSGGLSAGSGLGFGGTL